MGIKGLSKFVEIFGSSIDISDHPLPISSLLETFIEQARRPIPSVIIDGDGLNFYLFKSGKIDRFSGGMPAHLSAVTVTFVRSLIKAGAHVTIIYGGMSEPVKAETVAGRRLDRAKECQILTKTISDCHGDAPALRKAFLRSSQIPPMCTDTIIHTLTQTFGSNQVDILLCDGENDQVIAQYARNCCAAAIIGLDSDFLVFESHASYWPFSSLTLNDARELSVTPIGANTVSRMLRFHSCLLPLFAALAPSDFLNLNEFHVFILQRYGFKPSEDADVAANVPADDHPSFTRNMGHEQEVFKLIEAIGMFSREFSADPSSPFSGRLSRASVFQLCHAAEQSESSLHPSDWTDVIIPELLSLDVPNINVQTYCGEEQMPFVEKFQTVINKFVINEHTAQLFVYPSAALPADRLQVDFHLPDQCAHLTERLKTCSVLQKFLAASRRVDMPKSLVFQCSYKAPILLDDVHFTFAQLSAPFRKRLYSLLANSKCLRVENTECADDEKQADESASSASSLAAFQIHETSIQGENASTVRAVSQSLTIDQDPRFGSFENCFIAIDDTLRRRTFVRSALSCPISYSIIQQQGDVLSDQKVDSIVQLIQDANSTGLNASHWLFLMALAVADQSIHVDHHRLLSALSSPLAVSSSPSLPSEASLSSISVKESASSLSNESTITESLSAQLGCLNFSVVDDCLQALMASFAHTHQKQYGRHQFSPIFTMSTETLAIRGLFSIASINIWDLHALCAMPLIDGCVESFLFQSAPNVLSVAVNGDTYFNIYSILSTKGRAHLEQVLSSIPLAHDEQSSAWQLFIKLERAFASLNELLGRRPIHLNPFISSS